MQEGYFIFFKRLKFGNYINMQWAETVIFEAVTDFVISEELQINSEPKFIEIQKRYLNSCYKTSVM